MAGKLPGPLGQSPESPGAPSFITLSARQRVPSVPSLEQGGLHDEAGDHVGVQVGGRASVLVVAALLDWHRAAHAD